MEKRYHIVGKENTKELGEFLAPQKRPQSVDLGFVLETPDGPAYAKSGLD